MRKGLFVLYMFFVSCFGFSQDLISYNSTNALKHLTNSVVKISIEYITEDKITLALVQKRFVASGFSIYNIDNKKSLILTNQHVCSMKGKPTYTITLQSGEQTKAKFIRHDLFADICLLETEVVIPPLVLNGQNATQGERVVTIGGPDGVYPIIIDGFISGYYDIEMRNELDEDGHFEVHFRSQVMSAPIYRGGSGSPVFNVYGKVIGIVFAVQDEKEHIAYIVPVTEVFRFLDRSEYVYMH